jgi:hypothetical protein
MELREATRVSARAASILTLALEKETEADARSSLTAGLAAVGGPMEPRQAARILSQALEKEKNANIRLALAQGLVVVVQRLSREETDAVCLPVMQTLLQATETEKEESERQSLAIAVASLLPTIDKLHASRIAAKMAFAVCSGRETITFLGFQPPTGSGEIQGLDALLTNDSRWEAGRRTEAVAIVVGLVSVTPYSALRALPAASEPLPCRLSTQELVELLKMPTCYGEARKAVLNHLGNSLGRTFANHWEFVRFAQEQHSELDFLSPPKRPERR